MSTGIAQNAVSNISFGPARTVAVIDIGSTSIRMAIAEIEGQNQVRTIEEVSRAVSLGKDTFTTQSISRESIEECVRILKSYRRLMQEYGITRPDQIRLVATGVGYPCR